MPSICWGLDATDWASSISATKPPRVKISDSGFLLAPSRNAPPRPSSARPTACSTPDITNCQEATTGEAPQSRC